MCMHWLPVSCSGSPHNVLHSTSYLQHMFAMTSVWVPSWLLLTGQLIAARQISPSFGRNAISGPQFYKGLKKVQLAFVQHRHTHTHTQMHTHTDTHTHRHMHTQTHAHMHTDTHTHIHTVTHAHIHNACTCTHKHPHTCTYMYTRYSAHTYSVHTHTYIHTYTNNAALWLVCSIGPSSATWLRYSVCCLITLASASSLWVVLCLELLLCCHGYCSVRS